VQAGPFVSGKVSAVGRAQAIKDNLVLVPDAPGAVEAVEMLVGALKANPAFQAAAWPEAMLRPMFCRYGVGGKYGDHVDGAIMGDPGSQVRSDIAMTVPYQFTLNPYGSQGCACMFLAAQMNNGSSI